MTRHRSVSTILATLAIAAGLVMTFTSPASARIIDKGPFHDEFTDTDDNFCGTGMAVDFDVTVEGRFQVNDRGPGGLDYYLEHRSVVVVYTDQATLQTATDISPNIIDKDLSLVDNGDGTITIIELLTGGNRTLGNDGHLIAKNSGQIRLGIVYDYVNDVDLSNEVIFGSTGTNDDFCEAVLTDWGYLS
jgi:hypothetical protein